MKKQKSILALLMACLMACSAVACTPVPDPGSGDLPAGGEFAAYVETPVDCVPSIEAYGVDANLANVINADEFSFTEEAIRALEENHFVVSTWGDAEFFSVYEANRYNMIPNFITVDSMLHNYHLYFSHLLRTLEKEYLYGELKALTEMMLAGAREQNEALAGTEWQNAAERNVAFFSIAAELIGLQREPAPAVEDVIAQELALIEATSASFEVSPMMSRGLDLPDLEKLREDYTQYIPRSHYTTSEELKKYFRTMMWYGRMTFRAGVEDESRSAMLITLLLADEEAFERWSNLYEPTNFFVGKSDDVGAVQYEALVEQVYGSVPSAKDMAGKADKWESLYALLDELEPPAINSIPIYDESVQEDRDEAIAGFRFMGQRFTIDAQIFQKLIYRDVKENPAGLTRSLPKALDVPAAMGSEVALGLLEEMGETEYEGYTENMGKLRKAISSLDLKTRTQNLYWSWLHMLQPLTEVKGQGYPMFMQNDAWSKKQLESYLGSWTELKHDTVLYAKQAYAEMGGGDVDEKDDRGYVEPQPHVYGRLASLTDLTIRGLNNRGFLKEEAKEALEILKTLALNLKVIAEKELKEEALTDEEYDLIRSFGGQLEHLWLLAMSDKGIDSPSDAYENPAALVTDVATDPEGFALQQGIGRAQDIYVIVPVDGTLRIAVGAVFSHYEFAWPSTDRLTDEKWQEMLRENAVPQRAEWVMEYTLDRINIWQ